MSFRLTIFKWHLYLEIQITLNSCFVAPNYGITKLDKVDRTFSKSLFQVPNSMAIEVLPTPTSTSTETSTKLQLGTTSASACHRFLSILEKFTKLSKNSQGTSLKARGLKFWILPLYI